MGRVKSWFMDFDVVDTEQEYDQGEYVTAQDMLPVYPKHCVLVGEMVVGEEPTKEDWAEYTHYMQNSGL